MHVVDRLLAETAFRELPIEAADPQPVDRLQWHVAEQRTDVLADADAVVR